MGDVNNAYLSSSANATSFVAEADEQSDQTPPASPDVSDLHLYEIAANMFVYYDPLLTICGIATNMLMFAVMQVRTE